MTYEYHLRVRSYLITVVICDLIFIVILIFIIIFIDWFHEMNFL